MREEKFGNGKVARRVARRREATRSGAERSAARKAVARGRKARGGKGRRPRGRRRLTDRRRSRGERARLRGIPGRARAVPPEARRFQSFARDDEPRTSRVRETRSRFTVRPTDPHRVYRASIQRGAQPRGKRKGGGEGWPDSTQADRFVTLVRATLGVFFGSNKEKFFIGTPFRPESGTRRCRVKPRARDRPQFRPQLGLVPPRRLRSRVSNCEIIM